MRDIGRVAARRKPSAPMTASASRLARQAEQGEQQGVFQRLPGWQVDEREHGEEVERRAEQQQEQHPAGEQGDTIDGRGEGGRAVKAQRPVAEQNQREQRQAEQGRPFELPPEGGKKIVPEEVVLVAEHREGDPAHRGGRRRDGDDGDAEEQVEQVQLDELEKLAGQHVEKECQPPFGGCVLGEPGPGLA